MHIGGGADQEEHDEEERLEVEERSLQGGERARAQRVST